MLHCSPLPKRTRLSESIQNNDIIINIDEDCVVTTSPSMMKKIPPAISIDTDTTTYTTCNSLGSASSRIK